MAYSQSTWTGLWQVQGMTPGLMGPNILDRNVNTGPVDGKEPARYAT